MAVSVLKIGCVVRHELYRLYRLLPLRCEGGDVLWCLGVERCFSFVWVILAQWLVLMVVLSSYVYGVVSSALCWWYIVYGVQRCVGGTSWTISSTLC